MPEYIVEPLVDVRNLGNLPEEHNLPPQRKVWGTQGSFSGTPMGMSARKYFRDVAHWDYDDMIHDKVYYVGDRDDETGLQVTWYVPGRQSGPNGPAGKRHWVPTRIRLDRASVRQEQREQSREDQKDQQRQLDDQLEIIKNNVETAKKQAQIRQMQEELARIQSGSTTPPPGIPGPVPGGPLPPAFKTYELFGVKNGMPVPLMMVLVQQNGRFVVSSGAQVMVGDSPSDGYRLGGVPGRWQEFYAGHSPSEYGLDPDKGVLFWQEGTQYGTGRPYVVPAQVLTQLFGPNWRTVVY